jgi:BMFP domain-containing protein YqiC
MIETRHLDEITHRLGQVLPPGLQGLRRELEDNFRAILQSNLEKLDLVSRERFEASQALLATTRAKLDQMEERVAALEAQQGTDAPTPTENDEKNPTNST